MHFHHCPALVGEGPAPVKGCAPRLGWQRAVHRGKQWDFEEVHNFCLVIKKTRVFCLQTSSACLFLTILTAIIREQGSSLWWPSE